MGLLVELGSFVHRDFPMHLLTLVPLRWREAEVTERFASVWKGIRMGRDLGPCRQSGRTGAGIAYRSDLLTPCSSPGRPKNSPLGSAILNAEPNGDIVNQVSHTYEGSAD